MSTAFMCHHIILERGEREGGGREKSIAATLLIRRQRQEAGRLVRDFCPRFRELAVGGQPFSSILPRE